MAQTAAHDPGGHPVTSLGLNSRKLGLWAFISSEVMFFTALIATYLVMKPRNIEMGGPIPHEFLGIGLTAVLAFILLMSSLTMVLALSAIQRGELRRFQIWIMATALFGATFIGGQIFEFTEFTRQGLNLDTSLFGSSFYVLTGLHGAHVAIGIVWLVSLWGLAQQGRLTQVHSERVEVAGLYWHFVDVVWIVIFTVIYLIPK
jgi:cytochrome c oxidase subunit 3/cytochrome o ubiquinol oxidase subunit 3